LEKGFQYLANVLPHSGTGPTSLDLSDHAGADNVVRVVCLTC
jgi:hypothetical protein